MHVNVCVYEKESEKKTFNEICFLNVNLLKE